MDSETTTPPPALPETEQRDCETCDKLFTATVVRCFTSKIVPRHCADCTEREMRRQALAEAGRRVLLPTVAERWATVCPVEFRTIEEGGPTDEDRLRAECPLYATVLAWRYGSRGLLLRGETGQRKTRLLWRLLRRQFDAGRTLQVFTAGEFGRSYGDAAGRYESSAWFETMSAVDVLVIDDLGKGAWSEAVRAVFFDLVDRRMRHGKPLLVTTNDDGEGIAAKMRDPSMGDPLVRRLREFCEVLTLGTEGGAA